MIADASYLSSKWKFSTKGVKIKLVHLILWWNSNRNKKCPDWIRVLSIAVFEFLFPFRILDSDIEKASDPSKVAKFEANFYLQMNWIFDIESSV